MCLGKSTYFILVSGLALETLRVVDLEFFYATLSYWPYYEGDVMFTFKVDSVELDS